MEYFANPDANPEEFNEQLYLKFDEEARSFLNVAYAFNLEAYLAHDFIAPKSNNLQLQSTSMQVEYEGVSQPQKVRYI